MADHSQMSPCVQAAAPAVARGPALYCALVRAYGRLGALQAVEDVFADALNHGPKARTHTHTHIERDRQACSHTHTHAHRLAKRRTHRQRQRHGRVAPRLTQSGSVMPHRPSVSPAAVQCHLGGASARAGVGGGGAHGRDDGAGGRRARLLYPLCTTLALPRPWLCRRCVRTRSDRQTRPVRKKTNGSVPSFFFWGGGAGGHAVVAAMEAQGLRPDNHLFAGLVSLFADAGEWDHASRWLGAKACTPPPPPPSHT
jgi:hypothetical protein